MVGHGDLGREPEHLGPPGFAAPAIDGTVVHDPAQVPFRVGPDLVPLAEQPLQCLLEQVLAALPVGCEQYRRPEQRIPADVEKRGQAGITAVTITHQAISFRVQERQIAVISGALLKITVNP